MEVLPTTIRQAPTWMVRPYKVTVARERLPSGVKICSKRGEDGLELLLVVLLPPIQRQLLVEVALQVKKAHPNQRYSQVGGCLAVVSGQDTKAARINGYRSMDAELGAEVGHRPGRMITVVLRKPGAARGLLHGGCLHHLLVLLEEPGSLARAARRAGSARRRSSIGFRRDSWYNVGSISQNNSRAKSIPSPGEVQGDVPQALEGFRQIRDLRGVGGHGSFREKGQ